MYLFVLSLQAYGLDYQSVLYIKKKNKNFQKQKKQAL